ncbi:hypothetical protein [Hyphobacterium sp.]|uniref:hypothetical protein n=1 Tax=Hyphobacterium sp. TaxID=2004662 RepID=UPI003749A13E
MRRWVGNLQIAFGIAGLVLPIISFFAVMDVMAIAGGGPPQNGQGIHSVIPMHPGWIFIASLLLIAGGIMLRQQIKTTE